MSKLKALIRKKKSDTPICPKCKTGCRPCGGVLGSNLTTWRCPSCNAETEDIEFEVLSSRPLNKGKWQRTA